jgi:hypothetical protein
MLYKLYKGILINLINKYTILNRLWRMWIKLRRWINNSIISIIICSKRSIFIKKETKFIKVINRLICGNGYSITIIISNDGYKWFVVIIISKIINRIWKIINNVGIRKIKNNEIIMDRLGMLI